MPSHSHLPWWQSGVIYQIYPRSFQDTTGDGVGDLPGVAQRLDYLSDTLGVDAIWLSPFYPSPMKDFGYDVADYTNVDPLFGTLTDFDYIVEEAHERGLKIIVDIVPNHTSDEHPWFVESRASRENLKRDWYVWADAKADGSPPNNWIAVFGGSAWQWDEATGQYYLHSFLASQPDLNWRNPAVVAAMHNVYRFWLERGVDGFRVDVAHFISKDPALRDNPPNPNYEAERQVFKNLGDYDKFLHRYDKGYADELGVHKMYRDVRSLLDEYSAEQPRVLIGEIHDFDLANWARYYGENADEFHMPFYFGLIGVPWDAAAVRSRVDAVEAVQPEGGWPNYVLGNHDEHRIVARYGRRAARVAAMLLLTLRGTPTMYYGDEIGMDDVDVPPEKEIDPWGLQMPGLGLGRDPERTPMQWSATPNAGFSASGVQPWLPLADDFTEVNVEVQRNDPGSLLNLYTQLLTLRREFPALHSGDYTPIDVEAADCFVYRRSQVDGGGDEELLVALNFADEPRTVALSGGGRGRVLLSTDVERGGEVELGALSLAGNEGVVLST